MRHVRASRPHAGASVTLPDFLGLGGMRCGSTQLHRALDQHPDLFLAAQKELHYFDNLNGLYDRGPEAYAEHFADARPGQQAGEITPQYFSIAYARERIRAMLPDVRLFVILRNPIGRVWSHYCYNVRSGYERLGPLDALDEEETRRRKNYHLPSHRYSYIQYSCYATHLRSFYELFPREQIHVSFLEEFVKAPHEVLGSLCRHLGVRPDTRALIPAPLGDETNKGRFVRSRRLQHALANTAEPSGNSLLQRATRKARKTLLSANAVPAPRVPESVSKRLRAVFREPDAELAQLLGRELPWGLD
jgi:hypothetical protein